MTHTAALGVAPGWIPFLPARTTLASRTYGILDKVRNLAPADRARGLDAFRVCLFETRLVQRAELRPMGIESMKGGCLDLIGRGRTGARPCDRAPAELEIVQHGR